MRANSVKVTFDRFPNLFIGKSKMSLCCLQPIDSRKLFSEIRMVFTDGKMLKLNEDIEKELSTWASLDRGKTGPYL